MPATTTEHEEENPLFWPVQVGNMTVNHRVVLAPMTRCRAIGGVPQESLVKHYAQRASLGGLLISEANAVSPEAYGKGSVIIGFDPGLPTCLVQSLARYLHDGAGEGMEKGYGCGACQGSLHLLSDLACWSGFPLHSSTQLAKAVIIYGQSHSTPLPGEAERRRDGTFFGSASSSSP